jgi:polyisoprenoid-binding protein YceI
MVITNVKGTFDRFSGTIVADAEDLGNSSVEVIIETASVNTRNDKRDEHLRSADFLDAENHPEITFRSSEIRRADAGYVALGTLTIRGVAKEVALPFTVNGPITNPWGQTVIGIEIGYELNRQDYGVSWSQSLDNGGLVVGDTVRIEINLEAQKQS